ncbi:MAG TPA: tRNA guanosine(34) transglycosylase Tgt [Ardenticatenaceae bacterium]|nr:tRNA guanosine(34) transglycosylase Tgt [Ardenticatenaceae bacterium]
MNQPGFGFDILHRDGAARVATFRTPHGAIETPAFVAVGTQATVKSVTPDQLRAAGIQVIFANTYHLDLGPGADVIAALGGLHRYMGWDRPILTDSGGFQVFSLGAGIEHGVGKISNIFPGEEGGLQVQGPATRRGGEQEGVPLVKIREEGVTFKSHLDGSRHEFTAEKSIEVQRQLGADIVLAFDECTSPLHPRAYEIEALERTHRWETRSLAYFQASEPRHGHAQALYGIVQGGAHRDLRLDSAAFVARNAFDGIAIGGNLGSTKADMHRILEWVIPELPDDRPRHLLGIGEIPDIFEVVERGVDTFDCVAPTRNARNAALLARTLDGEPLPKFRINVRNARFKTDDRPITPGCGCYTCTHFSRAYLHHLFRAEELLAYTLATIHNLHFLADLMVDIRAALTDGRFAELKADWLGII